MCLFAVTTKLTIINFMQNIQYRSPEEYNDYPLNEKIDVYSMGNNIYALLTGLYIFYEESESKTQVRTIKIFLSAKACSGIAVSSLKFRTFLRTLTPRIAVDFSTVLSLSFTLPPLHYHRHTCCVHRNLYPRA